MASKSMRITGEAEMTALKYGQTVSKGILAMQERLQGAETVVRGFRAAVPEPTRVNTATPSYVTSTTPSGFQRVSGQASPGVSAGGPGLVDGMPVEYWKRIQKELDAAFEKAQRGF